jgi:DNA-binding NtrC family response regulator
MEKPKVLLVENNHDIHELLTLMMVAESIELMTATNCDDAIAITKTHAPSLILLDLTLSLSTLSPGNFVLDARRLNPALKVILISGKEKLAETASAWNVAYLKKPFSLDDLSMMVRLSLPNPQH